MMQIKNRLISQTRLGNGCDEPMWDHEAEQIFLLALIRARERQITPRKHRIVLSLTLVKDRRLLINFSIYRRER